MGRPSSLATRRRRARVAPYLLALPAALLAGVFVLGTLNGVLQGFGIMPSLGLVEPTLDYWAEVLSRPDLLQSLWFSLSTAGLSALGAVVGGILLSWALVWGKAGGLGRLISVQVPLMTMHALVALAVIFLFSGSGVVPRILHGLGLVAGPADFPSVVGAPSGWGIVAVYLWKEIPYVAFCTVTIMAHVSDSLGEAAATCGASPSRAFLEVVLPLCLGAALRAGLVCFAFAFGSYEVPFLLGPTAPKALPVLAYQEFTDPDLANRAVAMAIDGVVTLVCALATLGYLWLLRRQERTEGVSHGEKD